MIKTTYMKKLLISIAHRMKTCFYILFKWNHWIVLSIEFDEILSLLNNKESGVKIIFHGMHPYIYRKLIKSLADSTDDIDMLLDRIEFEMNVIHKI